ncbi:hypothetical protein AVEN_104678-1 [Araneus ventricosus]|uniref:Uncharacterized protein n=1 Tax=Araneus ventricosus TaxID=182803 RepID=A0A4Y2BC14_ARAVE|nr:hypothetical protein AVEN_104678-1 [Araneus ventricosus]
MFPFKSKSKKNHDIPVAESWLQDSLVLGSKDDSTKFGLVYVRMVDIQFVSEGQTHSPDVAWNFGERGPSPGVVLAIWHGSK